MFCTACGNEQSKTARFCPKCGHPAQTQVRDPSPEGGDVLRTIRESEAFAQGSKLLQSAREEVQQIDVQEYASKAGAFFRSVNWKLIGFIALSAWLLLAWDPVLTFFPACCLLLIAWRRGYTWATMLLLASVLLGLVQLSRVVWSDAGQGDLVTTFFHAAWYLPFVSLGLNILAVLLFFLDHAG